MKIDFKLSNLGVFSTVTTFFHWNFEIFSIMVLCVWGLWILHILTGKSTSAKFQYTWCRYGKADHNLWRGTRTIKCSDAQCLDESTNMNIIKENTHTVIIF